MIKIEYLLGVALLLSTGIGRSQDRVIYTAGKKQELLAPAASFAIEDENIALLDALKKAGWDPSLPIGKVPGELEFISFTPMTMATLGRSEKVLRWLIQEGKVSLDNRDAFLERAIDRISSKEDLDERDLNEVNAVMRLLERDVKPQFTEAMDELACNAVSKFGNGRYRLIQVNGAAPAGEWLKFDESFSRFQKLANARTEERLDKTSGVEDSPEDAEPKPLRVTWEETDDGGFRFLVADANTDWGGGTSGVIYFKHGYWLTKDRKSFDG